MIAIPVWFIVAPIIVLAFVVLPCILFAMWRG